MLGNKGKQPELGRTAVDGRGDSGRHMCSVKAGITMNNHYTAGAASIYWGSLMQGERLGCELPGHSWVDIKSKPIPFHAAFIAHHREGAIGESRTSLGISYAKRTSSLTDSFKPGNSLTAGSLP